ncbi:MAG: S8 family serine peptidase [Bacteroidota bacterium]|nr:S8 family serine peptidase [Bacteroidota bacterium]
MFKILRSPLIILISLLFLINISNAADKSKEKLYLPGQIIVKFKNSFGAIEKNSALSDFSSKYRIEKIEKAFPNKQFDPNLKSGEVNLALVAVLNVPSTTDIELLAKKISADPMIEYAEPNYLVTMDATPNDPLYPQMQHLPQVKAPQAWDISKGDTSVIIAIIDTGVDWDHPDLANAIWRNQGEIPDNGVDDDGNDFIDDTKGWDFVTGVTSGGYPGEDLTVADNNPMDFNGHGTHVAGIAAGISNNSLGIASLVWSAKIMPIRIGYHTADGNGSGSILWMAQAFVYAADNGARIANLSFGSGDGTLINDAARYAHIKGVVVCHSAGNGNAEGVGALGATPFALSVASVNESDVRASYSNFGADVDVSAPGGDALGILSTVVHPSAFYSNEQYTRFAGTSMATPLVASLAGLIKAHNPSFTQAQIIFQLLGTADNIDPINPSYIGKLGSGRINAYRALTETAPMPLPKIVLKGYSFYEFAGDMDNNIEPGETIGLAVTLENEWGDAINTSIALSTDNWAISVTNPTANMDTIYGISNLEKSTKSNFSNPLEFQIHSGALPEVIPLILDVYSDGYQTAFLLQLPVNPTVLLVEDNIGQVGLNEYAEALQNIGVVYRHWDRENEGSPSADIMQKYSAVIWFADVYVHPYLESNDRANLGTYLADGGNLFIAGMDFGFDMADPQGTEYIASGGASKIWYENNLRAKYISDGTDYRTITGVANDTIGNGLSFSFNTPWPSVIDTLNGSKPVFRYPNKSIAGIRYNGNYRLVYLSFGSMESIGSTLVRQQILDRSLAWLTGFKVNVIRVKDTEDVTIPIPISATVNSRDSVLNVYLAWSKNNERPYNKLLMTQSPSGVYEATIPPAMSKSNFGYKIIVETNKGLISDNTYTFKVGPDHVPPVINVIKPIPSSLKLSGPYKTKIMVTDNVAVDKDSTFIYYKRENDENEQRQLLTLRDNDETFGGLFNLSVPATCGQNILYYFSATDSTSNKNSKRFPETGYYSFRIGLEIIDDFEEGIEKWNIGKRWTLIDSSKKSGKYSITDGFGKYPKNFRDTLTLLESINLTNYNGGRVKWWRQQVLHRGDTCYFEISNNKTDWNILRTYITISRPSGGALTGMDSVEINPIYFGPGNDSIYLRFRLTTDDTLEGDGIYFDDIEVITTSITNVADNLDNVPETFALFQNYPNPFNPTTTIKYQLPEASKVILKIYNTLGQEVRTLVDESQNTGTKIVEWNSRNNFGNLVSSGVYFYRLEVTSVSDPNTSAIQVMKMILIK